MTRALLSLLAIAALSLCGGCKIAHSLHGQRGLACHDGCQSCNGGGPCAGGQCAGGQCAGGHAAGCQCQDGLDGHISPYEPFNLAHQGPPQRAGVLSMLGAGGAGGPPAGAQPAPGPSAAGVSYPYYTNRGPRDFLSPDPRGIGP